MSKTSFAGIFVVCALVAGGCSDTVTENWPDRDGGQLAVDSGSPEQPLLDSAVSNDGPLDGALADDAGIAADGGVCADCDAAVVVSCGNGSCDPGEDCVFCPRDCGSCDVQWLDHAPDGTAALEGVDFPTNVSSGYAVGRGGVVLATADRGQSWLPLDIGVTVDLYGVDFVSDDVGYVVGGQGAVFKTVDRGVSWTTQIAGTSATLRAVHFIDGDTGLAVGDDGVIVRTTDGGQSWALGASGTSRTLRAVQLVSKTVGYAAGDAGTVLVTGDGGVTWSVRSTGTTADFHGLAFTSVADGYVVGAGGLALKTSDSGSHWTTLHTGVITVLRAVAFPLDALHGYAVGDGGMILRTVDGGASWQREDGKTTASLRAVSFPAHWAIGVAVGENATVIERQPSWDASVVYDLELSGLAALSLFPGAAPLGPLLYAGTSAGHVFALIVNDRIVRYRPTLLDDAIVGRSPVGRLVGETDPTVLVSTAGGFGYVVDGATGAVRWQTDGDETQSGTQPLGDALIASPIVASSRGLAFFATHNLTGKQNRLFAFDVTTGACQWVFNGDCNGSTGTLGLGQVSGAPIRHPATEQLFLTSTSLDGGPTVWAIDTSVGGAGAVQWTRSFGDIDASPAFVEVSGASIYVGTSAGAIHRLRATDGKSCWTTLGSGCDDPSGEEQVFCTATDALATSCTGGSRMTSDLSSIVFGTYAGRLIFATGDLRVLMIDADGTLIWKTTVDIAGPSFPVPLPDQGHIYLGSSDGKLHELDFETGVETGAVVVGDGTAQVGAPVYDVQGNHLFVATTKGRIYSYSVPF